MAEIIPNRHKGYLGQSQFLCFWLLRSSCPGWKICPVREENEFCPALLGWEVFWNLQLLFIIIRTTSFPVWQGVIISLLDWASWLRHTVKTSWDMSPGNQAWETGSWAKKTLGLDTLIWKCCRLSHFPGGPGGTESALWSWKCSGCLDRLELHAQRQFPFNHYFQF